MNSQDWDQVVIRKKAPTSAAAQKPSAVNAAIRAGATPELLVSTAMSAADPRRSPSLASLLVCSVAACPPSAAAAAAIFCAGTLLTNAAPC